MQKSKVINVYKSLGITPLQAIDYFKLKNPEFSQEKIGYAGRLDPMAQGVLLLLIGEENKNKKKYEDLNKEYEFEVLFGVETDTYDILGKITSQNTDYSSEEIKDTILKITSALIGDQTIEYPPYSSKTVKGKPLYFWARQNRLEEIEIPKREITIYSLKVLESSIIRIIELKKRIFENIQKVKGDFRQEEIINEWEEFFNQNKNKSFLSMKFSITCSTGTYVRSIGYEMGKTVKTGAIVLNINRTRVGKFVVVDSLHL